MDTLKDASLFKQAAYINGSWVTTAASYVEVTNPATGAVVGRVPDVGAAGTQEAVDAAAAAFGPWKKLTAKERSTILRKWNDLVLANRDDLALIMTLEQGKPLAEAKGEIGASASNLEWFAEEARRAYGDIIPPNRNDRRLMVFKEPIGVAGMVTPWNFPSAMITRKAAPALAAGCTVVLKPSELTPFSATALCVLAERAGMPKGVLNVVTGLPAPIGSVLTGSKTVRKFGFTGSTPVGKMLLEQCAKTCKRVSMELGGHAPVIVMDDADMETAIQGVIASKFRNAGMTCVSAARILVQRGIYDSFVDRLSQAVAQIKVGNGLDADTKMGPLINEGALRKVDAHVKDAVAKGAKVLTGGKPSALGGNFYEPTVLRDCKFDMVLAKEETFGPVAGLFAFDTEDEAIQLANNSDMGLASYIYSRDLGRVFRISQALEYGLVGVNDGNIAAIEAPFGGVKESGMGREGSKHGLDEFMELKYVCLAGL